MNNLTALFIYCFVIYLGIKGLVSLWFFSGIAAVLVLLFAFPLLPVIGLVTAIF